MIYDGTPVESNGVQTCPNTGSNSQLSVGNIEFNKSYNDNAYVGYTYGEANVTNDGSQSDFDLYTKTHYHSGDGAEVYSKVKRILDDYIVYKTNLYYSTELEYKITLSYILS